MPEPITITMIIGAFLLGKYLPSYFGQKGKNLADKEDIAKLTNLVQEVKKKHTNDINMLKSSLHTNSQNSISLRKERVEVLNSFFDSCNQFFMEILEVRTTEALFKTISFEDFLLSINSNDFLFYMCQQQISEISSRRIFLRGLTHEIISKHHKLLLYFCKKEPLVCISEILAEEVIDLFTVYYKKTEDFLRTILNIKKIDGKILQEFQEKYKKEVLPNYKKAKADFGGYITLSQDYISKTLPSENTLTE